MLRVVNMFLLVLSAMHSIKFIALQPQVKVFVCLASFSRSFCAFVSHPQPQSHLNSKRVFHNTARTHRPSKYMQARGKYDEAETVFTKALEVDEVNRVRYFSSSGRVFWRALLLVGLRRAVVHGLIV